MAFKSEFRMEATARDQTKRVLTNLQNNLKRTGRTGARSGKQVTSAWKLARQALATAGLAFGARQLAEMEKAGHASQAVEDAFFRLNRNAKQLLETARTRSRGILDDTSLQVIANKLQGVGASAAQVGDVLDLSLKVAASTNKEFKDIADTLTQALLTGRSASLATLGVTIDSKEAIKRYALENNKAVDSVTAAEVATVKMNAALKELQKLYGDVDVSALVNESKKVRTEAENVWDTITRAVAGGADEMLLGLKRLAQGGEFVAEVVFDTGQALKLLSQGLSPFTEELVAASVATTSLANAQKSLNAVILDTKIRTDELREAQALRAKEARDAAIAARDAATKELQALQHFARLRSDINKLEAKGDRTAQEIVKLKILRLQAEALEDQKVSLFDYVALLSEANGQAKETGKELKTAILPAGALVIPRERRKKKAAGTGPSRAERAEQARQELEAQIDADNLSIQAHREMLDKAAQEDLARVKRVARETQQIQAEIFDFEQALAGKRGTELERLEAERVKRVNALTKEGGLESLENLEAAKLAIKLEFDLKGREIIDARDEADFRRNLERTQEHADALGSVFTSVADRGLTATAKWNQGIAATGQGFTDVGAALTKTDKETGELAGSTDRYATATAGALGAAASFVKGERKKAVTLAAMEAAHSVAAFASQRYAEGVAHAAAAGLYGAVAGGAFSGRRGGRSRPQTVFRAPEAATSTGGGAGAGAVTYIFNYRGPTSGRDAAREMVKTINDNKGLVTFDPALFQANSGRP